MRGKRFLLILLSITLFALAACGPNSEEIATATEEVAVVLDTATPEPSSTSTAAPTATQTATARNSDSY